MSSPGRHHLAFVLAGALVGAFVQLGLTGPLRLGATVGLLAGLVSGLISLLWVASAAQKTVQDALLALVGGFLVRMVLVPAALLTAKAVGGEALACAGGFFVLYAVGQGLEISLVVARARAQERRA